MRAVSLTRYAAVTVRGVNLGGRGDSPPPQNLEWGTPMYNALPQILTFLCIFPLLRASTKHTLYSIYFIDKQLPLRSINHPLVARAKQK